MKSIAVFCGANTGFSPIFKEKTIEISAQEHLKKFYETVGFQQTSESYLEDDIPHIRMLKK